MSLTTSVMKLLWLTKEDPSRAEIRNWRLVISAALLSVLAFVAWALGFVWNTEGLAYAADVDKQIEKALEPVGDRLTAIELEQTVQGGFLKTLVKNDSARQIRNELRARCKSTSSEEKERINAAIEKYQADYKTAAGEKYDEPNCEDL